MAAATSREDISRRLTGPDESPARLFFQKFVKDPLEGARGRWCAFFREVESSLKENEYASLATKIDELARRIVADTEGPRLGDTAFRTFEQFQKEYRCHFEGILLAVPNEVLIKIERIATERELFNIESIRKALKLHEMGFSSMSNEDLGLCDWIRSQLERESIFPESVPGLLFAIAHITSDKTRDAFIDDLGKKFASRSLTRLFSSDAEDGWKNLPHVAIDKAHGFEMAYAIAEAMLPGKMRESYMREFALAIQRRIDSATASESFGEAKSFVKQIRDVSFRIVMAKKVVRALMAKELFKSAFEFVESFKGAQGYDELVAFIGDC